MWGLQHWVMYRRLLVAAGFLLTVIGLAITAAGAYAYSWSSGHADVIAPGVTVAGIDVGGLHAPAARGLVASTLDDRLSKPVQLVYGSHRFTVQSVVRFDVARMVDAAVADSHHGGLATRLWRDLRGRKLARPGPLTADVPVARVETAVFHVARVLDRPAKNALVVPKPLATGLKVVPERVGLAGKQVQLPYRLAEGAAQTHRPAP